MPPDSCQLLGVLLGEKLGCTISVCPISTLWTCLPQPPSFPASEAGQPFTVGMLHPKNVLSISRAVMAKCGWPRSSALYTALFFLLWDLRRLPHFQVLGQYLLAQVHWLHSMYMSCLQNHLDHFDGLSDIWCFLVLWLYMATAQSLLINGLKEENWNICSVVTAFYALIRLL